MSRGDDGRGGDSAVFEFDGPVKNGGDGFGGRIVWSAIVGLVNWLKPRISNSPFLNLLRPLMVVVFGQGDASNESDISSGASASASASASDSAMVSVNASANSSASGSASASATAKVCGTLTATAEVKHCCRGVRGCSDQGDESEIATQDKEN